MPDGVLQALATPEMEGAQLRLDFRQWIRRKYIQDVIRYFDLGDRVTLCGFEPTSSKIWMDSSYPHPDFSRRRAGACTDRVDVLWPTCGGYATGEIMSY